MSTAVPSRLSSWSPRRDVLPTELDVELGLLGQGVLVGLNEWMYEWPDGRRHSLAGDTLYIYIIYIGKGHGKRLAKMLEANERPSKVPLVRIYIIRLYKNKHDSVVVQVGEVVAFTT